MAHVWEDVITECEGILQMNGHARCALESNLPNVIRDLMFKASGYPTASKPITNEIKYQHKIIRNHPQETIWKFESSFPYLPPEGDKVVFPDGWKHGEWFVVTRVEHYIIDRLIVIRVNQC